MNTEKTKQYKEVFRRTTMLAVPIMVQNAITNAAGLIDNIMVGSIDTEAMTAVSIAGQLIFVFNLAIFGGLSGPGIFGAQYYGRKDTEGVRNVFRIKLWIGIICTIIGTLIFVFKDDWLLGLYLRGNDSAEIDKALTLYYAKDYLRIMLIGLFPFALTQVYSTSLRETNESFKPMIAGIVSVVINIVFNYLLIFGKFGFPKLGVEGAAYATVFCRFAECAVIVLWAHLSKKHEFIKGIYRTILVPKKIIKPIIIKTVPILLNEFLWSAGLAAMTQNYSLIGVIVLPAQTISNALCNLMNVVFIALGNAVGIIVGQYLGAGEFEKAKQNSKALMWFTAFSSAVVAAILIGFSGMFPKIYNTSDDVKSLASKFIFITACFFPLQGFLNSLYFTLRSGGKTIVTFLFDSCFSWVVCVPASFLLCKYSGLDIIPIFIMIQALDFIKVIVGYIMINKGIWISNIVKE